MHVLLSAAFLLVLLFIIRVAYSILYVPLTIQRHFRKQGVTGPAYRPIFGNSAEIGSITAEAVAKSLPLNHAIVPRVLPFYHKWSQMYGETFLYWFGWRPRLAVADPEMVKEVLLNTRGAFGRTLALLEAKVVLATILSKFTLEVSPTYVHAPVQFITLKPQFGIQIRFRKA
uniref:Cytochrome P450 n=1 Tax=Kalanchoe fedtschenkoi TaxID=63787 RepID=A0A7N0UAW4_KALFE